MRGHVAEELGPVCIEQSDIVEAADVAGQAQLQRLTQLGLAVALALRGLVDQDGADPSARRRSKPEDR